MIPELGNFALILALCFALIQTFLSCQRKLASSNSIRKTSVSAASLMTAVVLGQFVFLSFAFLCLILSFLQNDMTVIYVREHSHPLLPFIYRVGATWGGHEGSLLLWCFILSGWTTAFLFFVNNNLPQSFFEKIISVLGLISSGFIAFLFFTSNPFWRNFPSSPITGNDLTPVLQDPGLIFHPPMLYLGYVGFAIGFAFAIAALIEGKFDNYWVQACRPFVILPWGFLSGGIVLGSWWAYRELGWGGWWFWDPVENASLLPWLAATALIHSLIVSEKRSVFKGWTLLLAIITFALCLLGTFLVRSGVLVSVHAFANDPTRGAFLLLYLAGLIGSALVLYALRIHSFYQEHDFQLFSRETFLLLNTVFLLTAVATIVLGTLYPIMLDAFNLEKISVGEPYFTTVFVPIIVPLLLLMGFAPHVNWGRQSFKKLLKKVSWSFFLSLIVGCLTPPLLGFKFHWLTAIGIVSSLWIIFSTLQYVIQLEKTGLKHASMIIAHLGIAIIALGITVNKSYSEERQVKMRVHETVNLAGYGFTFKNLSNKRGKNYQSVTATFEIQKNHGVIKHISAEQRIYPYDQTLSKTGIVVNWWGDLYIALGAPLQDGAWSVRLYYKPLVRFIWLGGFMLLAGGLLALAGRKK